VCWEAKNDENEEVGARRPRCDRHCTWRVTCRLQAWSGRKIERSCEIDFQRPRPRSLTRMAARGGAGVGSEVGGLLRELKPLLRDGYASDDEFNAAYMEEPPKVGCWLGRQPSSGPLQREHGRPGFLAVEWRIGAVHWRPVMLSIALVVMSCRSWTRCWFCRTCPRWTPPSSTSSSNS